jgi:hypothetical protein
MPIRKKVDIGFNRRVRASWLSETLRLSAAGVSADEIETRLKEQISLENPGKETVRKVFIYLNRVWIRPPAYCTMLRDEALALFRFRPDADSAFLLNWGMCLAAYPFIAHVAEATGRLLRLQGAAQATQVNVRIRERFGDRHFVHRSVRYNLSTFLESGALHEGEKAGLYQRGRVLKPIDAREIAWLVEALLHSQDNSNLSLQRIMVHGALFPFDMTDLSLAALKGNPRLDLFRHGLSETLIGLRMGELPPPGKN